MDVTSYDSTRRKLTEYFDQTAAKAWEQLTSDAPVSGIRRTVRAGRDEMRSTLLGWLPDDLRGVRILDAGCGTGALALEAADRGADVTAVDVSPTLVDVAKRRAEEFGHTGQVRFLVGDMLNPALGTFDYVVAMDSLIHYVTEDIKMSVAQLAQRARHAVMFTFAPRTPALAAMHFVGRMIPQAEHRAPAIVPVGQQKLMIELRDAPELDNFSARRTHRVSSGFYTSQALELVAR
ncbi:MAG: magnesium protoporphyrin IX methyltransferase [Pseudomonadota bacterium]